MKTRNKSETYLKNELENEPENETENKLKNRLENNAQIKPEIKLEIKPLTDLRFRLDVSFFNFLLFFESQHIKSVWRLFMNEVREIHGRHI